MKQYLGLAGAALLAACGGNTVTNIADPVSVEPDNAGIAIPAPAVNQAGDAPTIIDLADLSGQQFADMMAASDAFQIESAKLALAKATTQPLKDFATTMLRDHAESSAKLKAAAGQATPAITPDTAFTPEQQANLETLRSATGTDFDTAYKGQQQVAHERALTALKAYSAAGEVAPLKAFAIALAPVVQRHADRIGTM